jgi:hypothetical protein
MTPDQVVVQLEAGPRRLAAAVQTLYRGNWDDCAEDVRRRAAGRPYLYRLDLPGLRGPEETLSWLRRLGAYESARGERLPAITSA